MDSNKIIPFNQDKPIRADAQRNRRILLDTAERLFEQEDIESVTMSAIAKKAGVGKGTLYRHFADKADLCHALLDEDMREFQAATLENMRYLDSPTKTLHQFLADAVQYTFDHMNLLREVSNIAGVETLQHPAHLWWWQTIRGLVARIDPDGDASYIADVLYVMLDVQTIRFQRHTQRYENDRILEGIYMTTERLLGEKLLPEDN